MTTPAQIEARWIAFRNPAEDDEGVSLDNLTADSFVVMYADQGGEGADQVALRLALAFESPADFAGFLRHSELPRCVAWDSGSRAERVEDYEAYIGDYTDTRQQEIRDCAALLEAVVAGGSDVDAAIGSFNRVCAVTEPRLFAEVWGDLPTVLRSHRFTDEFAEITGYEPEGQVAQLLALLEKGTFDASDEKHLDLAVVALEELEEY